MSTGRRPNRSASMPNSSAPSGRMASVSVTATETAFTSVPNSAATARSFPSFVAPSLSRVQVAGRPRWAKNTSSRLSTSFTVALALRASRPAISS